MFCFTSSNTLILHQSTWSMNPIQGYYINEDIANFLISGQER